MHHSKLRLSFIILLCCAFLFIAAYPEALAKSKTTSTKEERIALKKAESERRRIIRENRQTIKALYKKAFSYYAEDEITKAEQIFRQILSLDPDEKKAKFYIAKKLPARRPRELKKIAREEAKIKKRAIKEAKYKEVYLARERLRAEKRAAKEAARKEAYLARENAKSEKRIIAYAKKLSKKEASAEISLFPPSDSTKYILDEGIRDFLAKRETPSGLLRQKKLQPRLSVYTLYDDNIFLTKDDTKDDIVTHLSPGISAYYGNANHVFMGSYESNVILYADYARENRINQRFDLSAFLFKQNPVKIRLSESAQATTDPPASETTEFVKRFNNDFTGTIRYDMSPKASLAFGYNQTVQNYISSSYQSYSYIQNDVSPVLYWHFSPKVSLTAGYNLGAFSYYEGKNYDFWYHKIRGGIEGNLTKKSSVYLKAGYEYRDYRNLQDTDAFVLEGAYSYKLSPKTSLELIASRTINESTYRDVGYYRGLSVYASCTHRLPKDLKLNFSGFYIRSDYPHETLDETTSETEKRLDNLLGGSVGLEYIFRHWVSAYTQYEFKFRESNMRAFEYKNNKISVGVRATF